MRAKQMSFKALVGEETELALLAVQRRPVVDHLRVDFHLVDPLHVIAQLLQVFNIPIADLTYNKRVLRVGIARFHQAAALHVL